MGLSFKDNFMVNIHEKEAYILVHTISDAGTEPENIFLYRTFEPLVIFRKEDNDLRTLSCMKKK